MGFSVCSYDHCFRLKLLLKIALVTPIWLVNVKCLTGKCRFFSLQQAVFLEEPQFKVKGKKTRFLCEASAYMHLDDYQRYTEQVTFRFQANG